MVPSKSWKIIKLVIVCLAAVVMNILLSTFVFNFLRFPLYLDTVFSATVTFAAGLIPGLAVAVLSWLIPTIYYSSYGYSFYVLCSLAEVVLIYVLKPPDHLTPQYRGVRWSGAVKLVVLYIICAVSISVLGGIINYVSDVLQEVHLPFYSVEDTFKLGLITSNLPALAVNIVSRIQVNIVDRFIVIFGGFFISRGLARLL